MRFSWCVEFKSRNNQKIQRQDYYDATRTCLQVAVAGDGKEEVGVEYYIDLKTGDYDCLLEVYRDILMVGMVRHYKLLKKYNLQQL